MPEAFLMSETEQRNFSRLREIIARLRSPDGCPWDREQTHESLRAALIEECYEAIAAIESKDDANLSEELGDLLLLVLMHTRIAEERAAFRFEDLVDSVCEKLVRRHPHVFGSADAGDSGAVLRQWEQIKREEKGERTSALDGVPKSFPALLRAQSVQKKAARVGFDWQKAGEVFDKLDEEIAELREAVQNGSGIEEEMGDLLFSAVNLARKLKCDSEKCLNSATDKFERRFKAVEAVLASKGLAMEDQSLAQLDQVWNGIKEDERH